MSKVQWDWTKSVRLLKIDLNLHLIESYYRSIDNRNLEVLLSLLFLQSHLISLLQRYHSHLHSSFFSAGRLNCPSQPCLSHYHHIPLNLSITSQPTLLTPEIPNTQEIPPTPLWGSSDRAERVGTSEQSQTIILRPDNLWHQTPVSLNHSLNGGLFLLTLHLMNHFVQADWIQIWELCKVEK